MSDLMEIEAVYMGMRLTREGKRYIVLAPADNVVEPSSFDMVKAKEWKAWSFLTAGSVIKVKGRLGDRGEIATVQHSPRWERLWEDEEDRLKWGAAERLAEIEESRLKMAKDTKNELHEKLDPVRNMYQRAVGMNRTMLLAEIVRYITC